MVNIIREELIGNVKKYDVVLVGLGINNSFSGGFAYDIGLNFPYVKRTIRGERYLDRRKMGTADYVSSPGDPAFEICFIHGGGFRKDGNGCYLDYSALDKCVERASRHYGGKKIASTVMGCSKYDGNGDKERVLEIFGKYFTDADIDIYDYEQETFDDKIYRELTALEMRRKRNEIGYDEYIKEKNALYWKRRNGIFKEMPEGYTYKRLDQSEKVINVKKEDLEK